MKKIIFPQIVFSRTGLNFCKKNLSFIIIFLIPFCLCVLYFGFIESDIYLSESSFIVRQPEQKSSSSLGVLLDNIGITSARDETYVVKAFILSRDSFKIIDENLDLGKLFGGRSVDILNRFNPLGLDGSFEALYKYLKDHITLDIDATSSIATLKVRVFSGKAACVINEGLLFMSEGLINKLNDRAKKDMVNFAQGEVDLAEAEARKCAMALSAYQDQEILFDPAQQSSMQFQHVSRLQTELLAVRGQISQFREFASESPQIKALEKRAQELRKVIDIEMSKVAGGAASMSHKLIEFERLKLDREFSEKRLATALTTLEQARAEALRQQLYLERISQPSTPDEAIYPRRVLNILASGIFLLMAYSVSRMFFVSIVEHQD